MIRRCLILDTETTGLDPAKDRVIALFDRMPLYGQDAAALPFKTSKVRDL